MSTYLVVIRVHIGVQGDITMSRTVSFPFVPYPGLSLSARPERYDMDPKVEFPTMLGHEVESVNYDLSAGIFEVRLKQPPTYTNAETLQRAAYFEACGFKMDRPKA